MGKQSASIKCDLQAKQLNAEQVKKEFIDCIMGKNFGIGNEYNKLETLLKFYLSLGGDINKPIDYDLDSILPLEAACQNANLMAVKFLLSYEANPNIKSDCSSLLIKHSVVMHALLYSNNKAFGIANHLQHFEIFKLLLKHGADVDCKFKQLVHPFAETSIIEYAYEYNKEAFIECLKYTKNSTWIHKQDDRGNTILHQMCEQGNAEEIKELIGLGVDIKAVNKAGDYAFALIPEGYKEAREAFWMAVDVLLIESDLKCPNKYYYPNSVKTEESDESKGREQQKEIFVEEGGEIQQVNTEEAIIPLMGSNLAVE